MSRSLDAQILLDILPKLALMMLMAFPCSHDRSNADPSHPWTVFRFLRAELILTNVSNKYSLILLSIVCRDVNWSTAKKLLSRDPRSPGAGDPGRDSEHAQ